MKYLYLFIIIGSVLIPILFCFHPKLKFYKYWKSFLFASIVTLTIFIVWDIIFTQNGLWGYNDDYFVGDFILSLPLEKWLFLICIPFACVFTHYALQHYFPRFRILGKNSTIVTHVTIATLLLLCFIYYDKWYTIVDFLYAIILLLLVRLYNHNLLESYYPTFLVLLIPFFIVNEVLTGSWLAQEIVWYNHMENLDFRLGTIPFEDSIYAFSLILTNLSLTKYFYAKFN
ncbi:lycopene cyclase [Flavobacteriales bacterium 34_180_T64]|nr:lycopene cyclase [Flavobacteriales bacterium 34_180_T64]